jgi:hypothetical protein
MTIFFILSLTRKSNGTGDPVRFSKQDGAIIKYYQRMAASFPNQAASREPRSARCNNNGTYGFTTC